ncbi:copper chaperone PCu(A)C [Amycolatopsis sp. OK19-0408]|uniref:Copper chaperone PCu(A)C n=1 Tax=Amycolatopsis iheyensis TaxID=2945988 RepID=A0A9X2SR44_9PSEU|nr:copper chaperone PCu(A)C [Amycolatopsis iheyensis]MCR6490643.1 copper chaperone PCu(A)C [Amycolatopsis iheyensis]
MTPNLTGSQASCGSAGVRRGYSSSTCRSKRQGAEMCRRMIFAAVAAAVLVTAGCSPSDRPAPDQGETGRVRAPNPAVNKPLQTLGSNVELGPISLLNVFVMPPATDQYQAGQDAVVRLTLVNRGTEPDALTGVSSELAGSASIHWDRGCDGTAEQVDRLPITAGGLVPAPTGTRDFRHSPYYVELHGLRHDVAGTNLAITFTFEHAGTATVSAKVRPRSPAADVFAPLACRS